MAYVKFKDGRELRGWKAALIASPCAIMFAPVALVMGIVALPLIAAYKLRDHDVHKGEKTDDQQITGRDRD